MRLTFLTAAALLWFVGNTTAGAEAIRQTLEAFGFAGTWARQCDEPASPTNNMRIVSASPSGDPLFTETLGPNSDPNIYIILRATRLGDDTIVLRTKLNGGVQQDLTMRRIEDRLRTMTNREVVTGRYIVRDGEVVSNKVETPWLTRCAEKSG